ncbi:hypothetical protein Tco_1092851 [Tanacetum coccineum]|uniref:Uncharacterized protein n=1 Tax=Tanacetum coccineum TaxID=301880 RepID=A0ABQ5IB50_9ASTR
MTVRGDCLWVLTLFQSEDMNNVMDLSSQLETTELKATNIKCLVSRSATCHLCGLFCTYLCVHEVAPIVITFDFESIIILPTAALAADKHIRALLLSGHNGLLFACQDSKSKWRSLGYQRPSLVFAFRQERKVSSPIEYSMKSTLYPMPQNSSQQDSF